MRREYQRPIRETAAGAPYGDHLWRLFGTALSFAVFGMAGLVIGLLVLPLLFVFIRSARRRQRAARTLIGRAFAAFIRMMSFLGVLSYEIEGRENIVRGRARLIVANHPTLIDVVFLVSMFPEADCVIKSAVTRNIFMRSTVAAANYISNAQPDDLLESCAERLRAGGALLLFPEGTRTEPGRPIEFRLGAASVAVRTGAEVLPIAISCIPPFLTRNEPWYAVPASRPRFVIRVLSPVSAAAVSSSNPDQRRARRELNDALVTLINRGIAGARG